MPSLLGRTCSLLANRQRDLIYQGAAYERGDVGADRFLGPVDNHHRTVAHLRAGSIVERDCPTICARGRARGEFVDLCLYGVDHLQTEARSSGLKNVRMQRKQLRIVDVAQVGRGRRRLPECANLEDGVLAVLPPVGSVLTILRFASTSACRAIRNTSSMRGPQKRSNSCLNTRSALPTSRSRPQPKPNIEQVQPERPPTCAAHVQVDRVTVPASRHHAERRSREIAVRSTSTTVGASRPSRSPSRQAGGRCGGADQDLPFLVFATSSACRLKATPGLCERRVVRHHLRPRRARPLARFRAGEEMRRAVVLSTNTTSSIP